MGTPISTTSNSPRSTCRRATACGGLLKPDVVFFGENVPKARVGRAMDALQRSDAMLVVGSSLMVLSGYRFARAMAEIGKPIAAVNLGRTRADDLLAFKVTEPCTEALSFLLREDDSILPAADAPRSWLEWPLEERP